MLGKAMFSDANASDHKWRNRSRWFARDRVVSSDPRPQDSALQDTVQCKLTPLSHCSANFSTLLVRS